MISNLDSQLLLKNLKFCQHRDLIPQGCQKLYPAAFVPGQRSPPPYIYLPAWRLLAFGLKNQSCFS